MHARGLHVQLFNLSTPTYTLHIHSHTIFIPYNQGPASAEVAAHERVRGFQYGGELLPVDQAAEVALKWQEEEVAMRLVTFLPAARVKRWHALSNAMAIKPHAKDGYPRNALLLASLGQALRQNDCVALVRCVRRSLVLVLALG